MTLFLAAKTDAEDGLKMRKVKKCRACVKEQTWFATRKQTTNKGKKSARKRSAGRTL